MPACLAVAAGSLRRMQLGRDVTQEEVWVVAPHARLVGWEPPEASLPSDDDLGPASAFFATDGGGGGEDACAIM